MASPNIIPYDEAIHAASQPKVWAGGARIVWRSTSARRFPAPYSFRAALEVNGKTAEGWFVDLYFKRSRIPGARDTLSMVLIANSTRIIAIDDNGPSAHVNSVGAGLPFFQQQIDHPHLHIPVPDGSEGYAEPLASSTDQALWRLFLAKANISGAPPFELPEQGQMGFSL